MAVLIFKGILQDWKGVPWNVLHERPQTPSQAKRDFIGKVTEMAIHYYRTAPPLNSGNNCDRP